MPTRQGLRVCMRDQAVRAKAGITTIKKAELVSPFTALGRPLGVQTHQQTTGRWISVLHAAARSLL